MVYCTMSNFMLISVYCHSRGTKNRDIHQIFKFGAPVPATFLSQG